MLYFLLFKMYLFFRTDTRRGTGALVNNNYLKDTQNDQLPKIDDSTSVSYNDVNVYVDTEAITAKVTPSEKDNETSKSEPTEEERSLL